MRVIAGVAKGHSLKTAKDRQIRPTSDRVRESLFNVLGARTQDARFLDLFAGSGAVGIEALSRGAQSATFVELNTAHFKIIEENLRVTGLRVQAELLRRDARGAIVDLSHRQRQFDLIFIDPPYSKDLVPPTLTVIAEGRLLAHAGWIICEHYKKDLLPEEAGSLHRFRELIFGETVLSLYREANVPVGGNGLEESDLSGEF